MFNTTNVQVASIVVIVCIITIRANLHALTREEPDEERSSRKCICGRGSQMQGRDDLEYRVVGGVKMKQKAHQYLAGIRSKKGFCGGTIVSPFHILTAAHCTVNRTAADMKVYLGLHHRTNAQAAVVFPVREIIRHRGYRKVNNEFVINDIALLRVDRIHFKDTIQPICLPFNNEGRHNKLGTVAGWGVTYNKGKPSQLPHKANLRIMSPEECLETPWGPAMRNIPDSEKMVICAYKPATDACQGDSGGPLYAKTFLGSHIQLGIVSFGDDCANTKGIPGIYTNLAYYGYWLRKHLHGQECSHPF